MTFSIRFLVVLFCLVALPASAAQFYSNLTVAQLEVDTDFDSAKPYVTALKLGYQFSQTLALEAQYATNAKDDDFGTGKIKVDNMSALFLRIGGQTTYNDVRFYLLVGRSRTKVKYDDGAVEVDDEYEGNAWGIGAEEYSKSVKNMAYVLEYIQYDANGDETVTGINLGLRYDF